MRKIIRKFLRKMGYDTRVRTIYSDETCGYPKCDRLAYMAFFLTGGVVYSCLEHFNELMSEHGDGLKQMYEVDGNEKNTL